MAYAIAGGAILLLGWWLRNPLIPYGGSIPRASGISADSGRSSESEISREKALSAISSAIEAEHRRLVRLAGEALAAPDDPERAFDYLKSLGTSEENGVILADDGGPQAWAGQIRNTPVATGAGTTILRSPFYTSLQVVATR